MAKPITRAQLQALTELEWRDVMWWHDLPPGTRDVLHRKGWLREIRRERCSRRGCRHPGYVMLSAAGAVALAEERARG